MSLKKRSERSILNNDLLRISRCRAFTFPSDSYQTEDEKANRIARFLGTGKKEQLWKGLVKEADILPHLFYLE